MATRAVQLLGPMRMRKSPGEVGLPGGGGQTSSAGRWIEPLEFIESGRSEQAGRRGDSAVPDRPGADSADYVLVQAGDCVRGAPSRTRWRAMIRAGEPVSLILPRGWTATSRTPRSRCSSAARRTSTARRTRQCAAAHREALRITRPGDRDPGDRRALERRAGEQHGFPRETRTGHGIGLDVHEPPFVVVGDQPCSNPAWRSRSSRASITGPVRRADRGHRPRDANAVCGL